jgi:ATP-dependent protease ClpP protease subunit
VTTRTRRRPPRASRGQDVITGATLGPAGDQPTAWYHVEPIMALAEADPDAAETTDGTSADVYIFDVIGGWWGASADDFVRDVASLDVDRIVLHLNSPGGDASEGVAIANVLRAHRARVVIRVDGMAASAASVIAMAGDEVVMGVGSQMMVHDAWGFAQGNAAEMRKAAEMLDSTSNALASTYAAKAGGTSAEWREVMEAEAWYTADEAVAAGLADRVAAVDETGTAEGEQVTPGASFGGFWSLWDSLATQDRFDLSRYAYAGRRAAPVPPIPIQTPAASADRPSRTEGSPAVAFSDEQLTTMRQQLGLADDATEATIVAAISARHEQPTAPQNPPGTVVLDEAQHADLLAAAADGRAARAQQLTERRQALVRAAIDDGRVPPARRDQWLAYLEADPGGEETLAALKPGLVPVTEIGYAQKTDTPADPAAGDDYWFAGVSGPSTSVEG